MCPDGAVLYATRGFRIGPALLDISFAGGDLSYENDSYRVGHVKAANVHGHEGVIAEPYNSNGVGNAMALWPAKGGYMRVHSYGLTLDELMKIIEGVTCADC